MIYNLEFYLANLPSIYEGKSTDIFRHLKTQRISFLWTFYEEFT